MPSRLVRAIPWTTLRVRLTLLNTAVVLLATLVSLAAVRVAGRAALYREADAVLRGEVGEIAIALQDFSPDTNAVIAELRRKAVGHEERGWFTQLLDGNGTTIWKSDGCPREVADWPVTHEKIENLVQVGPYRFARRRLTDSADESFHVRIGMPTVFLDEDVDSLTRILIPVGLAISLLTPLAGYWLALRATSPIAGILRTAEHLKPTRLGDRLDVRGTHDELDRVSLTINRLLDQVAGYVERQQQFVTDAAHELRGPLAAIQNSLEVASAKERSSEDYRATLDVVLEETKHLSKMANDLLLLAEGESDAPIAFAEEVDLDAVLRQTANMFAGVAEDRAIQLLIRSPQSLRRPADQRQLCQVVSNLLDNAMRFTPAGGCLTLSLALDAASQEAVLSVADTGCGIHEQYQTRVFDRFFQVDAARDRSTTHRGGGLGLAICRSIVERHGGQIDLTSQMGQGTTVTVRLPL